MSERRSPVYFDCDACGMDTIGLFVDWDDAEEPLQAECEHCGTRFYFRLTEIRREKPDPLTAGEKEAPASSVHQGGAQGAPVSTHVCGGDGQAGAPTEDTDG